MDRRAALGYRRGMCGRYVRSSPRAVVADAFGVVPGPEIDFTPRYNVCPGDRVLAVALAGERRLGTLRWGLVPSFAKDAGAGPRAINARAEGLDRRPAFRAAFGRRRCLIVADGFYEWRREGRGRTPFFARPRSGRPLAFAGLWERWRAPDGPALTTCAIVTCPANATLAPIHERMPVVLDEAGREAWLAPAAEPAALRALLRPCPADVLEVYEVSRLVNAPRNDSPECIAPV
jgi:putative SOS response-associated peptidase YedK